MKSYLDVLIVVCTTIEVAKCGLVCTGNPPKLNGIICATTTMHDRDFMGMCGCGTLDTERRFNWVSFGYTVGASVHVFGENSRICGKGCGQCVMLTTTGGYVDGAGSKHRAGESHVFMITDKCTNTSLCVNNPNSYGYETHFVLHDQYHQLSVDLNWDNPEVTWQFIACDDEAANDWYTPSRSLYKECQCSPN